MSFSSKREVRAVLWIQNQSRATKRIGRNKIERKRAWVSRNSDPRKRYTLDIILEGLSDPGDRPYSNSSTVHWSERCDRSHFFMKTGQFRLIK